VKDISLIEDVEEQEWSATDVPQENDWSAWSPDLHEWLEALHRPDMTLEIGKRVWTNYKKHVRTHPELAVFLPLLFQQVGPYLYFDHLESLYSDLVETGQLTSGIGKDMIRQYYKRGDVRNAEIVADDLRAVGADLSGYTVGMLIRLHGSAGNSTKVWQYFDAHVQTPAFRQSQYSYLCGCLFIALGSLPEPQDDRLLSIFQLMVTSEEYFPNAPEYYQWLSENEGSEFLHEMPDFPLQHPIILPNPDAFCFNAALRAVKSVEAAKTIWDLAIRLRRLSPFVYANYVHTLAEIDTKIALEAFIQFSGSTYANKKWEVVHQVRRKMITRCMETNDLESLMVVLEDKYTTRHVSADDINSALSLQMRRGFTFEQIWDSLLELCKRFELPARGSAYRGLILEYLHRSEPANAELVLQRIKQENFAHLHYHHITPIPLWYLNRWLQSLEAGSGCSEEEQKQLEAAFLRTNEDVLKSSLGPSAFYIRVVSLLHPSIEFSLAFLARTVLDRSMSNKVMFSFTKFQMGNVERAIIVLKYLNTTHGSIIGPVIAKAIVDWAAKEKNYRYCFTTALDLIRTAIVTHPKYVPPTTVEGAEVSKPPPITPYPGDPTQIFILGGWVYSFTMTVLRPLGIRTHMHAYYANKKFLPLTWEQLQELEQTVLQWQDTCKRNNFKERLYSGHYNTPSTDGSPLETQHVDSNPNNPKVSISTSL
jgi:hypothetical protein